MSRAGKLLSRMRANPAGDWTIDDVQRVCANADVACISPRRGDHFKVSHASQIDILTIPAHRPIKAVYIRKLVKFLDDVVQDG